MAEKIEYEDAPQHKAGDDVAAGIVSAEELSPEEDKKLLRRIDMW